MNLTEKLRGALKRPDPAAKKTLDSAAPALVGG